MRSVRRQDAFWGVILMLGCAETAPMQDEVPTHPPEWSVATSSDFHGARVAQDGTNFCTSCHGPALLGDAVVPGCYDCHDGPGGHPSYWKDAAEPFHGTEVALHGPTACATCHGETYQGGWSEVSCYTCHAGGPSGHPEGWLDKRAHTFHGLEVSLQGDDDCRRCHGNDLMGGTSGVACADCHQ